MSFTIAARQALCDSGWLRDVSITVVDGVIAGIDAGTGAADHHVGTLLPALANVHSHSFQRAMAGLAEARGPNAFDDFWTWRQVMYRFLELLTPDDIGAIAAGVQMEMLEAGYAAQAEFHYLHHAPGGGAYAAIDETSQRHIDAALATGIGYTHLPVLYSHGGLDRRPLVGGQMRFGCDIERFQALHAAIAGRFAALPGDFVLGAAPHSLRAVAGDDLAAAVALADGGPVHIHAAEQTGEVDEVVAALGARPVAWLLANMPVDARWCFIHATHLDDSEVAALAASGAIAGLCPTTEANLGDGIFDAGRYLGAGGRFGIGSDSNIRIAVAEELRMLECSQRLRDRRRAILADAGAPSVGRYLYARAAAGGAQALGRNAGAIRVGALADLVALDDDHVSLAGLVGDHVLDTWIFACGDDVVRDVWAAGRHVVTGGRHRRRDEIGARFAATLNRLRALM